MAAEINWVLPAAMSLLGALAFIGRRVAAPVPQKSQRKISKK